MKTRILQSFMFFSAIELICSLFVFHESRTNVSDHDLIQRNLVEQKDLRGSEVRPTQNDADNASCPSMFIAVISKPDNIGRRQMIREMWQDSGEGWGDVLAKFAICADPDVGPEVAAEAEAWADMMLMDCTEGYLEGYLTRKVMTAMQIYLREFGYYDLFMKIDDDTFMSPRRICNFLKMRGDDGHDNLKGYMGVFAEGPREGPNGKKAVERNPESRWYEPESVYHADKYPVSAKGGPGYILGGPVVRGILTTGQNDKSIAETYMLHNEDKAVGVWVNQLVEDGWSDIEYVNIPGTDGYSEHQDSTVVTGPLRTYPHFLHHNLTAGAINCLHQLDMGADPDVLIDTCFEQ